MYADTVTDSMRHAISETNRRRKIQMEYNEQHGIDPQTIRKKVSDILLALQGDHSRRALTPDRGRRRRRVEHADMPREELQRLIQSLEDEMHEAARDLRFEYAARLRDEVQEYRRELAAMKEAGVR